MEWNPQGKGSKRPLETWRMNVEKELKMIIQLSWNELVRRAQNSSSTIPC